MAFIIISTLYVADFASDLAWDSFTIPVLVVISITLIVISEVKYSKIGWTCANAAQYC
jgi:hypothetical protein